VLANFGFGTLVPNDAKAPWVCRNIPARRLNGAQPGA
jgi:hypothetical protein